MALQSNRKPRVRDTVFMSGWLFADLLLALAVLFLAANTIGIKIPPPPPPKLIVTPTYLTPTSPNCVGGITQPRCTVTLTETADSAGEMSWRAASDISNGLTFSPANGSLSPGKSVTLKISHIPCENNSLTFSGSRGTLPVKVLWQCTPRQQRLDFNYQQIILTNIDYEGLLNGSSQAINTLKEGIERQAVLKGKSVGLAIVYGGAPQDNDIPTAVQIGRKVISVLKDLVNSGFHSFQRSSYYGPLHALSTPLSTIEIDVYLFIT